MGVQPEQPPQPWPHGPLGPPTPQERHTRVACGPGLSPRVLSYVHQGILIKGWNQWSGLERPKSATARRWRRSLLFFWGWVGAESQARPRKTKVYGCTSITKRRESKRPVATGRSGQPKPIGGPKDCCGQKVSNRGAHWRPALITANRRFTAPSNLGDDCKGSSPEPGNLPPAPEARSSTGGIEWQPEIWPMAINHSLNRVRPRRIRYAEKPSPGGWRRPFVHRGKTAASSGAAQPPRTSQEGRPNQFA